MGIHLNLLNLKYLAKLLTASGLIDTGAALITGDYMGAYNTFMSQSQNVQPMVRAIIEFGIIKLITSAIPGTSTRFGGKNLSVQFA